MTDTTESQTDDHQGMSRLAPLDTVVDPENKAMYLAVEMAKDIVGRLQDKQCVPQDVADEFARMANAVYYSPEKDMTAEVSVEVLYMGDDYYIQQTYCNYDRDSDFGSLAAIAKYAKEEAGLFRAKITVSFFTGRHCPEGKWADGFASSYLSSDEGIRTEGLGRGVLTITTDVGDSRGKSIGVRPSPIVNAYLLGKDGRPLEDNESFNLGTIQTMRIWLRNTEELSPEARKRHDDSSDKGVLRLGHVATDKLKGR